jgi:dihydrofolate reductase
MKLTAIVFVTLDGVYQGPGGRNEDRRGGFDRGGWQAPFSDEETGRFIVSAYENMDAMLLGRMTFDIWEGYWPLHDEGDPVSHGINVVPKYVPSTTRRDTGWQNTHFIDGDVEAKVRELKAQPGRDLLLQGSGKLLQWLLERDLVDELKLTIYPVILGAGLRLFPEQGQSHRLELASTETSPNGVMLQVYRPAGRATFADVEG